MFGRRVFIPAWILTDGKRRYTQPMLTLYTEVFLILFGMLAVTGVLVCLTHWLADFAESRVPSYRRELEAAYSRFHRFLRAVRAAAIKGVHP